MSLPPVLLGEDTEALVIKREGELVLHGYRIKQVNAKNTNRQKFISSLKGGNITSVGSAFLSNKRYSLVAKRTTLSCPSDANCTSMVSHRRYLHGWNSKHGIARPLIGGSLMNFKLFVPSTCQAAFSKRTRSCKVIDHPQYLRLRLPKGKKQSQRLSQTNY